MSSDFETSIRQLKEEFQSLRDSIQTLEGLIREPIDSPYSLNLWELSQGELDQEMAHRLSSLNQDINTKPDPAITSHRKIIGPLIVSLKKTLRSLLRMNPEMILSKQVTFNEDLVALHLASFIRFRELDKRIAVLEEKLTQMEESQMFLSSKPLSSPHEPNTP